MKHSNTKLNQISARTTDHIIYGAVGSTLLLTLISAFVLTLPRSFADDVPGTAFGATASNATVNVAASCSMTATINTEHTATIPNGIYSGGSQYYPNGIGQTTIQTFCNDPNGYAVYAVGYTGDSTTGNNTVLHSSSLGDTYNIPTGTATSGDTSQWAMKLGTSGSSYVPTILSDSDGSYAAYHKVPSAYTKVVEFTPNTDATIGSSLTTTYAAYINGTQPAGTYSGKVKYALMHPSNSAAPNADYMQNVASWGGALLVGEERQVVDNRDGKTYSVARLCTNYSGDNCTESQLWMTENLDLDIGGTYNNNPIVLDSTNTNITTAGTNPTAEGYTTDSTTGVITWNPGSTVTTPATNTGWEAGTNEGTVSGWSNRTYAPYYMKGETKNKDYYVYNGIIYDSLNACMAASHTSAQCTRYHVGNYYNFSAAVASNDTSTTSSASYDDPYYVMPNSICPKGWRLPKGLTKDSSNNVVMSEFNKLLKAQGVTGNVGKAADGTDTTDGIDLYGYTNVMYSSDGWSRINLVGVNGNPLYFTRSGGVYNSTLYDLSWNGRYWSSTLQSGFSAYYLNFNSGTLYPAFYNIRDYGFSVRCVSDY